jgi:hypothetical protein
MKKILSIAVSSVLLVGTVSATTVDYKQLRSHADTLDEGFVWSIASGSPPAHPTCLAALKDTVHGAAYVGALNTGGFPAGEDNDLIHDMTAIAVFDANELRAAGVTGKHDLVLSNTFNFGFGAVLQISVMPDSAARNLLQGGAADGTGAPVPRGPFPAGFTRIYNAQMSSNGYAIAESAPIPFLPAVTSQRIVLADGFGGSAPACLGPTGQVRIIDAENNGDWATECVAGGWRAGEISLGDSAFNDAIDNAIANNASITTCKFSCFPPTAAQRNIDCTSVITAPLALAITVIHGGVEADRGEEFLWTTLALGGDNYMVLAADPAVPSAMSMDSN